MKRTTSTTKTKKRFIRHEQWIEITRKEGKTVTSYYPSNLELEQLRLKMDPPPDMIYRRFNFLHGVPDEYQWLDATLEAKREGGLFLQRILPEDWPAVLAAELIGNGHAKSAMNPQPRPAVLGPCPCDQCTAERPDPSGRSRYDRPPR